MTLIAGLFSPARCVDNAEPDAPAHEADMIGTIDNANPGVLRVPYGRFHNPGIGMVQVFNKSHAEGMQRILSGGVWEWAKSVLRNGWSALSGKPAPVVIGHPNNADAPVYGTITKIEAADNEALFHVDWKPEGRALVTGDKPRFSKYSPRWKFQERGGEAHPFALVHMGLTNHPVIPVPSIDNADTEITGVDEGDVRELDNSETILGLAVVDNDCCQVPMQAVRSIREMLYLEPDATFEQVQATLASREAELKARQADLDAMKLKLEAEQQRADSSAASLTTANNELDQVRQSAEKMRAALVQRGMEHLQATGRVKPCDFAAEVARLGTIDNAEQIVAELDKIKVRPAALRTISQLGSNVAQEAKVMTVDNEARKSADFQAAQVQQLKGREQELRAQGMSAEKAFLTAFNEVTGMAPAVMMH